MRPIREGDVAPSWLKLGGDPTPDVGFDYASPDGGYQANFSKGDFGAQKKAESSRSIVYFGL